MYPLKKHIYLTGMMGSGKTTIGHKLARKYHCSLIDTDTEIEKMLKMSISKIFADKGEDFFREEEKKFLKTLAMKKPSVVSAGGGMVLSVLNREIFRKGYWINLKAMPISVYKRISAQKHRPLLGQKVQLTDIEMILARRRPYYDLAPHQVVTDNMAPDAIVEQILKIIRMNESY